MNTLLHINDGGSILHMVGEVLLDGFLDTLIIIPFLFLTYLLMEFIEHHASAKVQRLLEGGGAAGPLFGGILGAVPQCGFSAAGANLYTGRLISAGTLIAIFLSTSDEMLPIMIGGKVRAGAILAIIGYKALVAVAVGFIYDGLCRLISGKKGEISISEMCEDDGCNCKNGILRSALHHTLSVGAFVFIITVLSGALVSFVGAERISAVMYDRPIISHLIAALIGLIPNCAASVLLTNFFLSGFISAGTMMSGLFSGAGVGLLILFRSNKKRMRENLIITAVIVLVGIIFGFLFDVLNLSALL